MKKYGLIGRNISYSFSKKYFENKFRAENLADCTYDIFDLESIDKLRNILSDKQIRGLNVTIPYKRAVMDFLDEIDPQATEVGAVNTVKVHPDGHLSGHNSDVYGFRQALVPFLEPHHERALILGTGGASDAVAYVLRHLGIEYYFVSRQKREGRYLTYGELTEVHVKTCPLIVNATPLGTFPHVDTCPDIPYDSLDERNLLFDLVYNPPDTLFMKKGREHGAAGMLRGNHVGVAGRKILGDLAIKCRSIYPIPHTTIQDTPRLGHANSENFVFMFGARSPFFIFP